MRCLTDAQIESLVARPDAASALASPHRHAQTCNACREKLEQAQADAGLVGEIRELRERREEVKPLIEGISETGSTGR